ncbi:hypothetical protein H4582DRAFT_1496751 [Lactarius indigo]|nr:hypothetical protein H4582DRAFT_1496751 [Lactarius indigo]
MAQKTPLHHEFPPFPFPIEILATHQNRVYVKTICRPRNIILVVPWTLSLSFQVVPNYLKNYLRAFPEVLVPPRPQMVIRAIVLLLRPETGSLFILYLLGSPPPLIIMVPPQDSRGSRPVYRRRYCRSLFFLLQNGFHTSLSALRFQCSILSLF